MGGCFGCCSKPTPITVVDEPSKGLKIQGRPVKKPSMLSDDFWSTSTCDLEYSAVQSQRSLSSTSVPNLNPSSGVTGTCDFINPGLLLWQQSRLEWTTCATNTSRNQTQRRWQPRFGWNVTYEGLLGSRNPFPRPIPLSEMVDFLADVWEQEGLYD